MEPTKDKEEKKDEIENSDAKKNSAKKKKWEKVTLIIWEVLYFPILLLYLEVVFHLYMGLDMYYLPAFGMFAVAFGMIISTVCMLLPKLVNRIVKFALTAAIGFLFGVEMICKDILQQYYQLFSAVDTAAGNNLGDYGNAIHAAMWNRAPGVFLLLVFPVVFAFFAVLRKTYFKKNTPPIWKRLVVCVPICVVLHLAALGVVNFFPWQGDFTPKTLYTVDTYTDDQVEQLGIVTMLRLDAKHSLFGTPDTPSIDLGALEAEDAELSAEPEVEEIVYEPNVMEVDLQSLIDGGYNADVTWLTEFIQASTPSMQNEYTGMFEGYNVIFVTAEGFSGYVIDETLTPTLYKMANEGFVFNNFYSALHFTSTSGGEFQNLTGLYPKGGFPVSMTETGAQGTYLPFTLANALNTQGYTSIGYHFNVDMYGRELSHPNLGYDWRQADKCNNPITRELTESGNVLWPQSDDYMVEQTVNDYLTSEPFHIYYLTLSGHLPYGSGNAMSNENAAAAAELPYSDVTKSYVASQIELEKAMTRLVSELEAAGVADNTLVVLAPDHIPYADLDVLEELAGQSFGDTLEMLDESAVDFDVYKSSLIIWSASMKEPVEVDKVCCQVDILPTLLNLLGVEYDSRMLSGTDILSDSDGMVVFFSNSWMTDKGFYNRFTGVFTPAEGVSMTEEEQKQYVERMKTLASCKLKMSEIITENDYYGLLFEESVAE